MALRSNIINLRADSKMTQEDLAEKLGVSRQAVQKWESGDFVPELNRLQAMAKLFGVSLDELVGGDALGSTVAKRRDKRKREALRLVIVAIVLAFAGMIAMSYRDVIHESKWTRTIEEAESLMDNYKTNGRAFDMGQEFHGNADMTIPVYWDDWAVGGKFCWVNDPREANTADGPELCLRRDLENDRAAMLVARVSNEAFALMWAYALFTLSAYICVYAAIGYKFGKYWAYVLQAIIFGSLLAVSILFSVTGTYPEWELQPATLAPVVIVPLGYALANILIFGKRGLEADLD